MVCFLIDCTTHLNIDMFSVESKTFIFIKFFSGLNYVTTLDRFTKKCVNQCNNILKILEKINNHVLCIALMLMLDRQSSHLLCIMMVLNSFDKRI